MTAHGRRWLLAGVLLGAAVCSGCDFQTMAYFLTPEPKAKAGLHPLVSDPKKEVKVVIWTAAQNADFGEDALNADRDLGELLARKLKDLAEENGEKLTIVSPRKVYEYKNQHPDWRSFDLAKVGRDLRADRLIYLELREFSLYDKSPGNTLYKGHMLLGYSLTNVNTPDEVYENRGRTFWYPTGSKGGMAVVDQDLPWHQFRDQFLNNVATKLSREFLDHPRPRGQMREDYGDTEDLD